MKFVLEEAEHQPLRRRAAIYRGLAAICGDQQEAIHLKAIAADLERAELNLWSLQLQFNTVK